MTASDRVLAFLALAAIVFTSIAGGYARGQYAIAFDTLLEARRQTFIMQNGPSAPLPPPEQLMPMPRVWRLEELVSAFWWRPGDPPIR